MSTQIDERVVAMKFDARDFDNNVRSTMSILEKFENQLNFKGAEKGFDTLGRAADKVNLKHLEDSAMAVEAKFSTMSIVAISAINNIVNTAMNAGQQIVKSLTIDQVTEGFNKYESKMTSVQTIMNATGKTIDEVSTELDKLIWFTDETSYSFTDMVNNVGKFTSNQIDLSLAVRAMMGIADAAGLAGASVNDASHAMDGFSKAIAKGYMERQTWQWIRTAHMDTATFKQQLMDAAVAAGTLTKVGEGMYQTIGKGTAVSVADFESALSEGWLSTNAMLGALDEFGGYAEEVFKVCEEQGILASDAIDMLSGSMSELGEKGFRAAQEAKTFSDALNSVKDAVSSKWMTSFELLFGNYEEAKVMWTDLANELYDIFASGGDTRNEMLQEWVDIGGRVQAIATVKAAYQSLLSVLTPVKEAIDEMFPKITAENLRIFTIRLRQLVNSFKLTEKAAYTLKAAVKLLLVPIKAIFTAFQIGAVAIYTLIRVLGKLTVAFLELLAETNPIEDFFRNVFGDERYERIATSLATIFERLSAALASMAVGIGNIFARAQSSTKLMNFFAKIAEILAPIAEWILDHITEGFEMLADMDFTDIESFGTTVLGIIKDNLNGIYDTVVALGTKIAEYFGVAEEFTTQAENVKTLLNSFKSLDKTVSDFKANFNIGSIISNATNLSDKFKEVLSGLGDSFLKLTERLSPAKILLFGFGTALTAMLFTATNAFAGLSNITASVTSFIKTFESRMKPSKLEQIGKAMLILAGALIVMSMVDANKLAQATKSMMVLAGVLIALSASMALIDKYLIGEGTQVDKLAIMCERLGFAMLTLSAALLILNYVDTDGLGKKVAAIVSIIVALGGMSIAITKLTKGGLAKESIFLLSYAIAITTVIGALKKLEDLDTKGLLGRMGALISIMALLGVMAATIKNVKFGGALGVTLMIANMFILVEAMKKLAEFPLSTVLNALPMYIAVVVMLGTLTKSASSAGEHAIKAGVYIIALAAAAVILGEAIRLIGSIPTKDAVQGTIIVGLLLILFDSLVEVSTKVTKDSGGVSKALVMMSIAIMLLGVCISYLGNLDLRQAVQGTAIVSVLLAVFAGIIKINQVVLKEKEKLKGGAASIIAMAVLLGTMASALALLTLLPSDELLKASISLGIAAVALGAAVKLMNNLGFKDALGTIAAMVVVVGGLVILMHAVAEIPSDDASLIIKAGAISTVLIALAAAVRLLPDMKTLGKQGFAAIVTLTAVLFALSGVFLLIKDIDPVNSVANAAALSILLLALSKSVTILSKFNKQKMGPVSIMIGELVVVMYGIASVLGLMNELDPVNNLANVVALSVLLGAISMCARVLSGFRKEKMGPVSIMIGELVGVMYALGLLVGLMNGLDPVNNLANAVALSALLAAVSLATKFLSGFKPVDDSIVMTMTTLVLAVGALAGILAILQAMNIEVSIKNVAALSTLLVALAASTTILSYMSSAVNPAILLASLAVVEVAIVGLLGILYLIQDVNWSNMENAIYAFEGVGKAIGSLIGGLVSGLISAGLSFLPDIGTYLSEFVENSFGFVDGLKRIDTSVLEGAAILAGTMLLLTGSEILSGIGMLVGGGAPLITFGKQLAAFGPEFAKFADSLENVNAAKVSVVSKAVECLGNVYAILNGGILDGISKAIFGESSLADFGKSLADFGPYFAEFANSLTDVPQEALEATISAAKCLAELESGLPKHGGKLQEFFGDSTLGEFGENLLTFGKSMVLYSKAITSHGGIDNEAIEASAAAGKALAELESSLRGHGGALQDFFGDTNLDEFGNNLKSFGKAIRVYSTEITSDGGLNVEAIKESAQAGQALSDLENGLAGTNGTWQSIFGGNQDLGLFAENLAAFGRGLRDYAFSIANVSFDRITQSASAGEALSALEASLPETGGFFGWFDGSQDFGSFGEGLRSLGGAMQQYNDSIANVDLNKFIVSISSLEKMVDLGNRMNEIDTKGMKSFAGGLRNLASSGIADFISTFEMAETTMTNTVNKVMSAVANSVETNEDLLNLGSEMVDAILNGIIQNESKLTVRGQDVVGFILMGISSQHDNLTSQAVYLITVICDAIDSQTGKLKEAIIASVKTSIVNVQTNTDIYKEAKLIGVNVVKGVIEGIESESGRLNKAVTVMSQGMIKTSMKVLDEHSPSVVFNKIGGNVVKGMVEGIEQNEEELAQVMTTMNKDIIEEAENDFKIKDGISEVMRDRVGTYLIKGLADGITTDMSAEEATEKKAANIINAFAKNLEKYSREMNISNAEYSLWESIFGGNAKDEEITAKQREDYEKRLEYQGKAVMDQQAAYEAALREFGEDSEYTREAYLKFLQEYQNFTSLGSEYLELINTKNEWTMEAINDAARAYGEFMKEYGDKLLEQGFTQQQIEEAAKRQTGFSMDLNVNQPEQTEITDLIAKYIGYSETEIDAATAVIQNSSKKAVSTGLSTGVKSGVTAAAPDLNQAGNDAVQEILKGLENGDWNGVNDAIDQYIGGGLAKIGNDTADGLINGLDVAKDAAIQSMEGITLEGIIGTVKKGLGINSPSKVMMEIGQYVVEGLALGIENRAGMVTSIMQSLCGAINDVTSDSENTTEIGSMIAQEIVNGLTQTTNTVEPAIEEFMTYTLTEVSSYTTQFYDVGVTLSSSMIDGLVDGVRNRQAEAINEVVNLAKQMYEQSKAALGIGGLGSALSGLGGGLSIMPTTNSVTNSSMWKNISGVVEQAITTGNVNNTDSLNLQVVNSNFEDFNPSIVPILDLSNVEEGIGQINAMLSNDIASNISAQMNNRQSSTNNQNGSAQNGASSTNYNFYQTNTSPKSLSRIEIYRDTKNLLSSAKGV